MFLLIINGPWHVSTIMSKTNKHMGYLLSFQPFWVWATKQNVLTNEFATTYQEFLVLKTAEHWVSIILNSLTWKPTVKEYQTWKSNFVWNLTFNIPHALFR